MKWLIFQLWKFCLFVMETSFKGLNFWKYLSKVKKNVTIIDAVIILE